MLQLLAVAGPVGTLGRSGTGARGEERSKASIGQLAKDLIPEVLSNEELSMPRILTEAEHRRKVQLRLRVLLHWEQVTRSVSKTCRSFGILRTQFYVWRKRFNELGEAGFHDRLRGPRISPFRTPLEIGALALRARQERLYGD